MARKTTEIVALSLRVREELRRRLEREAKKQDRSLNAEIVHRLEQSFQKEDAAKVADAIMTYHLGTTEEAKMGPALVGLVALGTIEGRTAALAAISTEEGRVAAMAALKAYQKGSANWRDELPQPKPESQS